MTAPALTPAAPPPTADLAALAPPLAAVLAAAVADALAKPRPLTVGRADAAALVGIGVTTFDRLDAAGKTPAAVWVGGRKVYRTADLAEWVRLGCPDRRTFDALAADGEETRRGKRNGRPRR